MNQQKTNAKEFDCDAAVATIAARLVAAAAIWWFGITLVDLLPMSDGIYSRTMHIGLWLYLVELLHYCIKKREDDKQSGESGATVGTSGALDNLLHNFWATAQFAALGLLWRIPALVLGTCLVIVWCGYGPSAQLGAFVPTLIFVVARRHLKKPTPQRKASPFIRGNSLRTQADAEQRAPEINTRGPIELANILREYNEFTTGD